MNELTYWLKRYEKANEYMDLPFKLKLEGEELKKAVAEREKFIPKVLEIINNIKRIMEQKKVSMDRINYHV